MSELSNLAPLNEAQSEQAYIMAIQGDLELFIVHHNNDNKYKLSINQVSKIRGSHPNKIRIYLKPPCFDPRSGAQDLGEWQNINYRDIWLVSAKLNPLPFISENNLDAESSKYFREFKSQINTAIRQYPDWYKNQPKVQATANLMEWLTIKLRFNRREAEITKKILKDIYSDIL